MGIERKILEDPRDDAAKEAAAAWMERAGVQFFHAKLIRVQLAFSRADGKTAREKAARRIDDHVRGVVSLRKWRVSNHILDTLNFGIGGDGFRWIAGGGQYFWLSGGFPSEVMAPAGRFMEMIAGGVNGSPLCLAYPIRKAELNDRHPLETSGLVRGVIANQFRWLRAEDTSTMKARQTGAVKPGEFAHESHVPGPLYALLRGREEKFSGLHGDGIACRTYASRNDAKLDLQRAALRLARAAAGLPELAEKS